MKENLLMLKSTLLENINLFLSSNQWTIKDLSDASDIPYESVKKLVNGKINNPSIFTLQKIANALHCSIDYLIGRQETYGVNPKQLPKRAFKLLDTVAYIEMQLFMENQRHSTFQIPLIIPSSIIKDGGLIDSYSWGNIDIPNIYADSYDSILCGIKITSTDLEPTYYYNDVLLVAKDRYPQRNEIGVFLIENRIYIRKYLLEKGIILESINGKSAPIIVKDISKVHFIGRVLTTLRY